jgi:predicted amidophosphoribosyltransferase
MAESGTQPAVRFCHQCGRRIDPQRDQCWYCGASKHRKIRPLKTCSYCGSQVPPEAVKCRHCGEFLDGRDRSKPAAAEQPQQVVYVVDRALLQAQADRRLLPGQPVPPEVARRLSGPTVQAIEHNRPDLIDDPHVRALPAPAPAPEVGGESIVDVPAREIPEGSEMAGGRKLLPGASRDLVRSGGGGAGGSANLPSRREDTPQGVGGGVGGMVGGALAALGRFLIRTAPGKTRPKPEEIEVRREDRYRICEQCQTEMLADDNFCFHCGMQYHAAVSLKEPEKLVMYRSNTPIYIVIVLLVGLLWLMGTGIGASLPGWSRPVVAAASLGMCAAAFMRRRTFTSQLVCIVLVVATLGVWILV